MKTKNTLLTAIALLAGTLLSAPANAQFVDYHDEVEGIKQNIIAEIPTPQIQKSYIYVGALYNQMNEDLTIDYDKLFVSALNSVKDNKISAKDQYELMVFAIQTNHNKVLETLLKAGFKANIDVELGEAGTKVAPLMEIATKFNNKEALDLIILYTPKARLESMPLKKSLKPLPTLKKGIESIHGEYLQKIDKNYGSVLMQIKSPEELQRKIDSLRNQNK